MRQDDEQQVVPFPRSLRSGSSSHKYSTSKIIPYTSSRSSRPSIHRATTFLRSLFSVSSSSMPTCTSWFKTSSSPLSTTTTTPRRKITGTLFGHRRGHVTFAVQTDPRSEPVFLIELAVSTSTLVKEMSSGLVRIALESSQNSAGSWTMYCNGRKCGYANSRECNDSDWRVLSTVKSVSVGAGVIPMLEDGGGACELGELLYMRAKFERVVGSRDSEAYYMLNPDGNGGPELSIFLLRV